MSWISPFLHRTWGKRPLRTGLINCADLVDVRYRDGRLFDTVEVRRNSQGTTGLFYAIIYLIFTLCRSLCRCTSWIWSISNHRWATGQDHQSDTSVFCGGSTYFFWVKSNACIAYSKFCVLRFLRPNLQLHSSITALKTHAYRNYIRCDVFAIISQQLSIWITLALYTDHLESDLKLVVNWLLLWYVGQQSPFCVIVHRFNRLPQRRCDECSTG